MKRIGIVAGEISGDAIAADLILTIKKKYPQVIFEGIAGPKMKAAGCISLFDSERLAVMAFTEVLRRLPELINIRKSISQHFIDNPPDVFIGVDAPDFNLTLERKLKENNIKTVHYVSPSVWAWRQYRIKKITKSIDLMLTLLPFEMEFYKKHQVPVKFVGHPMADQIPLEDKKEEARHSLGCQKNAEIIALLPGSRSSEVQRLLPLLIETAIYSKKSKQDLVFLIPAATEKLYQTINEFITSKKIEFPITVVREQARTVMQAADIVILASGTATLEAMLLNRPMIVTYKVSAISYQIMKMLSNVKYVALPNFFDDTQPVPEYLQDDATVEKIGNALINLLNDKTAQNDMCKTFKKNHIQLKRNASEQAANAIYTLLE